jgi:SpoVK/Ycf46/Vps4 family AAA+-type ATPase
VRTAKLAVWISEDISFFFQAALNALQDLGIEKCSHVEHKHFIQALSAISPSLSREQVKFYENLALSL